MFEALKEHVGHQQEEQDEVTRVSQTGVLTCILLRGTSASAHHAGGNGGTGIDKNINMTAQAQALQSMLSAIAGGEEVNANVKRRTELNQYLADSLFLINEQKVCPP